MKLSEAILLGSIATTQGGCPHIAHEYDNQACALEAACISIGLNKSNWATLTIQWPWLTMKTVSPVDSSISNVFIIIFLLNDYHKWTRPQIAAWVAQLEGTMDVVPTPINESAYVTQR